MVLMLPCDDGDPRVELALLLIDLLPPEAREALPWRPQHTWERRPGEAEEEEQSAPTPCNAATIILLTLLTTHPLLLLILLAPPSKLVLRAT